jgi:hypothetical protein
MCNMTVAALADDVQSRDVYHRSRMGYDIITGITARQLICLIELQQQLVTYALT